MVKRSSTLPFSFPPPQKWSLLPPMSSHFLFLSALYTPSFLKVASPKSLIQALSMLPRRNFPQRSAKTTGAQCFTELPWLLLLYLLLRLVLCARLHYPVFSACKLFQWVLKVLKKDPPLALQVSLLPQTFLLWRRG